MAVSRALMLVIVVASGIGIISLFTLVSSSEKNSSDSEKPTDVDQQDVEGLYSGIEKEEGMVTVNNRQYYMTTLQGVENAGVIPKGTSATFQNVTFSFPYGSMHPPGGTVVIFEVNYPDGSVEKFGKVAGNGTHVESELWIPSWPSVEVPKAMTVIGEHQNPNAAVTLYNRGEEVKLLVSAQE